MLAENSNGGLNLPNMLTKKTRHSKWHGLKDLQLSNAEKSGWRDLVSGIPPDGKENMFLGNLNENYLKILTLQLKSDVWCETAKLGPTQPL